MIFWGLKTLDSLLHCRRRPIRTQLVTCTDQCRSAKILPLICVFFNTIRAMQAMQTEWPGVKSHLWCNTPNSLNLYRVQLQTHTHTHTSHRQVFLVSQFLHACVCARVSPRRAAAVSTGLSRGDRKGRRQSLKHRLQRRQ